MPALALTEQATSLQSDPLPSSRSFAGVACPPKRTLLQTCQCKDQVSRGPSPSGSNSSDPLALSSHKSKAKQSTWQEPPQGSPATAQGLHSQAPLFSPSLLHVSVGQVVIPLFVGHQVSPEKLYEAMEELNLAIQKLEDKFLQDKPFLIGPEISLADLVAIVELMQVRPLPQQLPSGRRARGLPKQSPANCCASPSPWEPAATSWRAAPNSRSGAKGWS